MRDIDEPARADDAALHQIQKVGAGGEISCARLRSGRDGLCDRRRPDIIEAVSCDLLAARRADAPAALPGPPR